MDKSIQRGIVLFIILVLIILFDRVLNSNSSYYSKRKRVRVCESDELDGQLSLCAEKDLPVGSNIGLIGFVYSPDSFHDTLYGAMINHSDDPNVLIIPNVIGKNVLALYGITTKPVMVGEELMVDYTHPTTPKPNFKALDQNSASLYGYAI